MDEKSMDKKKAVEKLISADLDFLYIPDDFFLDLQRFASAESEGRTETASEHKKKKAREEGRVALSKEIPAALIALFSFIAIYALAGYIFKSIVELFQYVLENVSTIDIREGVSFYSLFLITTAKIFLPVAAISFITAVFSNYFQIGWKITFKAIKPDFKKISPNVFKFLKKQVFSMQGFFNLIKSLGKIAIIGLVAFFAIYGEIEKIKDLIFIQSLFSGFIFIIKLAFDIVIRTTIILFLFAIVDLFFVRYQYEQSLKMKKQEVKEEVKELYGDPHVKQRLHQMYQDLLSKEKMLKDVETADVVVTNPTHYAVALKYDKMIDDAPRVVAKGTDNFAQQIKKIAKLNGVFLYENVPLARKLYADLEVNDYIPYQMYSIMVEVYRKADEFKLQGRSVAR